MPHQYQDARNTSSTAAKATPNTSQGTQLFEHSAFGKVRGVEGPDGELWFIASDVAKVLGYERPNDAIRAHCKKNNKFSYGDLGYKAQPYNIIPESDVYRLIMRSKLPSAKQFEEWVCSEVLPSIRKTGSYGVASQPASPVDAQIPKTLSEALMAYAKSLQEVEILEEKIEQDAPKIRVLNV